MMAISSRLIFSFASVWVVDAEAKGRKKDTALAVCCAAPPPPPPPMGHRYLAHGLLLDSNRLMSTGGVNLNIRFAIVLSFELASSPSCLQNMTPLL